MRMHGGRRIRSISMGGLCVPLPLTPYQFLNALPFLLDGHELHIPREFLQLFALDFLGCACLYSPIFVVPRERGTDRANAHMVRRSGVLVSSQDFHEVAAGRTSEVVFIAHNGISAIPGVNVPPSRSTSYFDIGLCSWMAFWSH